MTRKYLTGESVWGSLEEAGSPRGDKSLLESEDPGTGISILEPTSQRNSWNTHPHPLGATTVTPTPLCALVTATCILHF